MLRKPEWPTNPAARRPWPLTLWPLSRPRFQGFLPQNQPPSSLGRMSGMWLLRETRLVRLPEMPPEFRQ